MPFSFSPLGPKGRGQIQNARPQLIPGFLVVRLMHGSWWLSHRGTGFLVNSLDQSSLLAMGSITVFVLDLLGEDIADGDPVDVPRVFAGDSGGCNVAGPAPPLLVGCAVLLPATVLGIDASVGNEVSSIPSRDFGLKKPLSVFWEFGPPDGVDVDLERFAGMAGAGWNRLRGEAFEFWVSEGTMDWVGVTLGVGVAEGVGSVFGVGVDFSCALTEEVVRERVLGGLRANMSLMLRRLSTSNSGSRRPDVGSRCRDEYSCCRSPSLNIPGGFMISRI